MCSSCCLILLGAAFADTPVTEVRKNVDISSQLELFVSQAIDEGLLEPANSKPSIFDNDEVAAVTEYTRAAPLSRAEITCDQPYYLDFKEMLDLSDYREIYSFRETVQPSLDTGNGLEDWALTKAYIALGLNSEALVIVQQATGPQPTAYKKLATLLDNRKPGDIDYFRQLATCHEQATIWLALALLGDGQPDGARLLENQLSDLHRLPMQLRISIATLSVPALEMLGEKFLAEKLLADFTDQQIQNSSRLQFSKVFLDMGGRDRTTTAVGRFSQLQPQFQEAALTRLLRDQQSVGYAHQDILLDELITKIKGAEDEREIKASLSYALRELGADSRYQIIQQLAELPSLQANSAQAQIRQTFIISLRRDLASEDPLQNLLAIEALVNEVGILDDGPHRTNLYVPANDLAISFGFVSLSEQLALKIEITESGFLPLAKIAFRRGEFRDVYRLAQDHPDDQKVILLAALSAIHQQDRPQYRAFESRIFLQSETILSLIEHDAASGQWMVSDAVYEAAEALRNDDQYRKRVQTVLTLKRFGAATRHPVQNLTVASLPAVLQRTDRLLATHRREAR